MLPEFDPNEIKVVYLRCTDGEVGATSALALKVGPLDPSPKKRLTEVLPSASALIIKAFNIAPQMQHRYLVRQLSGNIKEILGTVQSVGCSVDGLHLHDIIDDINNGTEECPAS
ncbi:60S ribosomal protein L12-like [Panthera leo]|uniref:60S ribosomal protein L12-like n=1 Tax=Panthera leo TaxID=9689 RepID=UPI001C69EFFF|nr:60S ribosomal protein L12-like [Panthera leo]